MQASMWNNSAKTGITRSWSALERGDDQQRDHFAVGPLVLPDAQLGQLQQLLDPYAGVPKSLDDRPLPERSVFGEGDVDGLPGCLVDEADVGLAMQTDAASVSVG
jgi:hypothetical protein